MKLSLEVVNRFNALIWCWQVPVLDRDKFQEIYRRYISWLHPQYLPVAMFQNCTACAEQCKLLF